MSRSNMEVERGGRGKTKVGILHRNEQAHAPLRFNDSNADWLNQV